MCLIIIKFLMNNIIIMNETMSLLMATTILALGGLGLYMYKSDANVEEGYNNQEEYDEKGLFSSNFWNNNVENDYNEEEPEVENDYNEEYELPKRKTINNKTKRYKKAGSTKRRY